jgi:hypothetical protein
MTYRLLHGILHIGPGINLWLSYRTRGPIWVEGWYQGRYGKFHVIYRLMHHFFHIKTVIIPRDRYRPEGFSPRVDIRRGMITILIWKKACINLFITYFNIELKRTKLTSHRHQTYEYASSISVEVSASETPRNLSSLGVDIFQTTIDI